jgi:hypothetical protein
LCRFRFHCGKPFKKEVKLRKERKSLARPNPVGTSTAGSHMEAIYELLTFGVTRESIPILDDASLDLSHHHKLLETLRLREGGRKEPQVKPKRPGSNSSSRSLLEKESTPVPRFSSSSGEHTTIEEEEEEEEGDNGEADIILIPSHMDVLMGRGRQPQCRPGSLRMYNLLHDNMDAYEAATRASDKTKIAKNIIKEMKGSGCRFLQELEGGGYGEIDDSKARAKIARCLRNLRRHNKKKKAAGVDLPYLDLLVLLL